VRGGSTSAVRSSPAMGIIPMQMQNPMKRDVAAYRTCLPPVGAPMLRTVPSAVAPPSECCRERNCDIAGLVHLGRH